MSLQFCILIGRKPIFAVKVIDHYWCLMLAIAGSVLGIVIIVARSNIAQSPLVRHHMSPNTGLSLVKADHVTWALASDWPDKLMAPMVRSFISSHCQDVEPRGLLLPIVHLHLYIYKAQFLY